MTTTNNKFARLFTTSKRDNGEEYIHFTDEALTPNSDLYPIYQAFTNAMHDSVFTHEFSYRIAQPVADILADDDIQSLTDKDDKQEAITNAIMSSISIYTSDIMEICVTDSWAVDNAMYEHDFRYGEHNTLEDIVRRAWEDEIHNMYDAVVANLTK